MGTRTILVNCKQCSKLLRIEVEEDDFKDENKEIITVVHAHGDLGDKDGPHAVIVEIDRNFIIRDTKIPNQFVNSFNI
ncbi:MAG: hypothetical protein JW776_14550 [Candidatus Lokiarchaeota archaeon]|nr:hypothetical protein [Candidatus Lokiarchaeota archaeon]